MGPEVLWLVGLHLAALHCFGAGRRPHVGAGAHAAPGRCWVPPAPGASVNTEPGILMRFPKVRRMAEQPLSLFRCLRGSGSRCCSASSDQQRVAEAS